MTPIQCDHCGHPAPPVKEILERGQGKGLIGLGWACSGGKRVCPDCRDDREEAA